MPRINIYNKLLLGYIWKNRYYIHRNSMKGKIGLFVFLLVFLLQAIAVPKVGMTWDEPSSFFIGRANLRFWLTRDRSYITDLKNKEKFAKEPFQYIYGEDIYPPFPFVIASGFSLVLAERFHIVDVYTAHHLGLVLIGALGVAAIYGIGLSLGFPVLTAVGVALIGATYPTIVGQMRNDAKDVPLMSMICIFVFFFLKFLHAVRNRKHREEAIFGFATAIALGLTEATKVSAAILVPILLLWFIVSFVFFPSFRRKLKPLPLRLIQLILFGAVSLGIFILSWPWLWDDPIGKLLAAWGFFKTVGLGMPTLYWAEFFHAGVNLPKQYPFVILGVQTPPIILVLFAFGILASLYRLIRKRDPFVLLPIFWFAIGIGRFLIPSVIIYAKVRHFIDAMPAFFLIIGFGLMQLEKIHLPWKLRNISVASLCILAAVVYQGIIILQYFPYEPSYFNILAGGSKTVADKHYFDIEYWASAIREGMEYIESQAKDPGPVYACGMAHVARFYETKTVKVVRYPGQAAYTLVPNSLSWFGQAYWYLSERHKLVYTVKRNGADLLYVFQYQPNQLWFCGSETESSYDY